MEEREKKKKILYIVLGTIVLILLFFMISSCSNNKVDENQNAITNIELATNSITMTVDDEELLSYTILPSNTNETTRWVSSDSSVVTVDSRGNVKAIKTGSAIITLVSEGGVSDYVVVKVVSKLTEDGEGVTVNLVENDVNVKVGSTKKLNYNLYPNDSKYIEVMWESNNQLVATVSNDGVVTGLKSGVTTVTVKIVLSDNSVITDTATVTVEENASLYLTTTVPDIRIGEVIRLSAALSTDDVTITEGTVKSKNDNTASISNVSFDSNYLTFDVKGVKAGDTTLQLTAITSDGKTLNLDVPVTVVKFTDLYISNGNKDLEIGSSFILSGRLEPSIDGSLDTECKSSNEKSVTVSNVDASGEYNGACQITAIKEGSATVTMTISGVKQSIKVTVKKETEGTDDPTEPGNPGGTENPNVPVVGAATLSVSLDKTSYSMNEQATITVTFTDERGNTKTLSTGEYVVATEFDSSSFGTKKLVVVYPYGDKSLKAETEYTISGGSSGGSSSSGISGSGGYPSSGGSGSERNPGGTSGEKHGFEITSNNTTDEKGNYVGGISVKFNEETTNYKKEEWKDFQYRFVVFTCVLEDQSKCGKPPHRKNGNEFGNEKWAATQIYAVKGSDLDQELKLYSDGDGKLMSVNVYRDDCKKENCMEYGYYDINDPDFADKLKQVVSNNFLESYDVDKNVIIDSQLGIEDPTSTGIGGALTINPVRPYKQTGANAVFKVNATAKAGYRVISITSKQLGINQTFDPCSGKSLSGDSRENKVSATATFKNEETGKTVTVSAEAEIKIDDELNEFSCEILNNSMTVECTAKDELSGVESITSSVLGTKKTDTVKEMTYIFNFTKAGTYSFKAKDQAGNTKIVTIEIGGYACYLTAVCGEGQNAGTCKACQSAGCPVGNKPYHQYLCTKEVSETYKPTKTVYKEAPIKKHPNGEEWHDDDGYLYEAPQKFVDSDGFSCEPVSSDVQCGINRNILGSEVFVPSDFAANCRVCGCEGWQKEQSDYIIKDENLSLVGTSDSKQIIAYKIQYFKETNCQGEKVGNPIFKVEPNKYTAIVKSVLGAN